MLTKKDIPEELTVKIEKLSNLGFGIAKVDGYVIFVEGACPEDIVKIKIGKKNKSYANAKIIEIVEPSQYRTEPFCKMQKVCGACQLQYIDYEAQLKFKKVIVEDTMHNIYGYEVEIRDVIPSPDIKEYRHKIQYPVGETKESKRILAGYYKSGSHELVNIKYCPIQPEYCDRIIDFIRENAHLSGLCGYEEKTHTGDLRHVVIRTSRYSGKSLVVLVIKNEAKIEKAKTLGTKIFNSFENVSGVLVNVNPQKTNLIMGTKTVSIIGNEFIEEKLTDKIFKVGAKTFFQVNPSSANNIFTYVKEYVSKNFKAPSILDAYAGITAFGICLSDVAKNVVSVEEVKDSVDLAQQIIEENKINNVELYNKDAGQFFEKQVGQNKKYDVIVLDPPRKGCSEDSLNYALKLVKNTIIYVSCNPATLARDLKYLKENNCEIQYIQPFDMFPHTYHIENVAIIKLN